MADNGKVESQILREICDWLTLSGVLFWRSNNIPVFGRSLPKHTPKGLPDINIVHRGRYIAFEVKRPGSDFEREKNGRRIREGKLTPFQAEWATKLVKAGGKYHVVRSLEDAMDAMSLYIHADEAR